MHWDTELPWNNKEKTIQLWGKVKQLGNSKQGTKTLQHMWRENTFLEPESIPPVTPPGKATPTKVITLIYRGNNIVL